MSLFSSNSVQILVLSVITLSLTGCSDSIEAKELVASELVLEERGDFTYLLTKGDSFFSKVPWAWKYITNETESVSGFDSETTELCRQNELLCWNVSTYEVNFLGRKIVSVLSESDIYSGGAHGVTYIGDYTFDIETKNRMLFGELFNSWGKVRPILQKRFCDNLKQEWDSDLEFLECPRIEDTALTLGGGWGEKASVIVASTSDYQLGSYAAGRTEQTIVIDDEIRSHIKPEYLVDIE